LDMGGGTLRGFTGHETSSPVVLEPGGGSDASGGGPESKRTRIGAATKILPRGS